MALITEANVVIEHIRNGAVLLHSPEFSELRAAGRADYESDVWLAYPDDDKHNKAIADAVDLWVSPTLYNQLLTDGIITEITYGDAVIPGDFTLSDAWKDQR